jgi:hypothetical protein
MRVNLVAGVTHCAPVCVLTASSISRDMTKIFYFRCCLPSEIRYYIENKRTLFPAAQHNGADDCNVRTRRRMYGPLGATLVFREQLVSAGSIDCVITFLWGV